MSAVNETREDEITPATECKMPVARDKRRVEPLTVREEVVASPVTARFVEVAFVMTDEVASREPTPERENVAPLIFAVHGVCEPAALIPSDDVAVSV